MALVPDQKFSTFQNGGTPTTGDIIVGLRDGINTRFNWVLPSGVTTVTGTANQVLVDGSSGLPVSGDVTLSTPQDIGTTSSPEFNNLTLTGNILDLNGNIILGIAPVINAVNYLAISNVGTGSIPVFAAAGSDTNVSMGLNAKGTGIFNLKSAALTNQVQLNLGSTYASIINHNYPSNTNTRTYTWQDSSGTVAFVSQVPIQKTTLVSTTPYNVLTSDNIVLVNTQTIAAASSIVLPASLTQDGQVFTIKDNEGFAQTYNVTITVDGGGTIDGGSQYTLSFDDQAVSVAWSSSDSEYVVVYDYFTQIPVTRISGDSGTAVPVLGVIIINGGTTGLTTSASGNTLSLTGILIPANGGTGVNNGSNTLTLAGNLATSGAFASTFTMTGATNVTFPTSGTLATTAQLPTPAALTKTDDTNVTLTLGGTPATALLQATSLTLGWTGQLSLARGGSNANLTASNGGIVWSNATQMQILAGTATAGLALLSGASGTPSWSTGKPITQVISQIFTATGTYTPTSGMQYCIVEAVGGGGGGGGSATAAVQAGAGGGGGGGGYGRATFTAATIGASKAVTIGAAGTAGAAGNNAGGAGGGTSLGTLLVVGGGAGGSGSPAVAAASITSTGGAGGTATTGDILIVGQGGDSGFVVAPTTTAKSGPGGGSMLGLGGVNANNFTGLPGTGYGAGGSGGFVINGSAAAAGSAGTAGILIVTEFVSV